MTDEDIQRLIDTPKWAEEIRLATQNQRKREVWCDMRGLHANFKLLVRVNPTIKNDFSCVLFHNSSGHLILRRYNGSKHDHINHLERTRFSSAYHVHTATRRYIESRYKNENFAEIDDRFQDVERALECLIEDCSVRGLSAVALLAML